MRTFNLDFMQGGSITHPHIANTDTQTDRTYAKPLIMNVLFMGPLGVLHVLSVDLLLRELSICS